MDVAKRKRETLTHESDLRNVARKLFIGQAVPTGPRPSISGQAPLNRPAASRLHIKPPLPRVAVKANPRSSSLQPLRNVTNKITRPPDARLKPIAPRQSNISRSRRDGQCQPTHEQQMSALRQALADAETQRQAEASELRTNIVARDLRLKEQDDALRAHEASIAELTARLQRAEERARELEALVAEGERQRKRLHNAIQELRGNIRVIARVRGGPQPSPAFAFPDAVDHRAIELTAPATANYAGDEKNKTFAFSFDRVFEPGAGQAAVFDEISQVVQSALDGYKVTVFAYGQTGSGKTFTMEGPPHADAESAGMIPRAVAQIFEEAERVRPRGWEFALEATFIEIYLEEVRDLLGDPGGYEKRAGIGASGVTTFERGSPKHEIHHGADGTTTVSNVTAVPIRTPADVFRLLATAAKHRATAATKMNERSSRSHSVFTLRIAGHNKSCDQKSNGVLNLIDLAGSERLNASGAVGDRLKETQNINKSLACLGDVIAALAAKKPHVPYRNSKLTYLLQNCLGGDGKTLMFVNVSPEPAHLPESLCSLRFAAKVNACEIGTAKRKMQ